MYVCEEVVACRRCGDAAVLRAGHGNSQEVADARQPVPEVAGSAHENARRLSAVLHPLHQAQRVQEATGSSLHHTALVSLSSLCIPMCLVYLTSVFASVGKLSRLSGCLTITFAFVMLDP